MIKELEKLLDKIKSENDLYRIKITVRPWIKSNIYSLGLTMYIKRERGKKESRSLELKLVDDKSLMIYNKNNIEKAKMIRNKLEREILRLESEGKSGSIHTTVANDDFIAYFEKIAIEKKTQGNYKICKDHFIKFIKLERVPFSMVTPELCRKFVTYLREGGRSARTVHNYMICFRAVLNMAIIDGYIKKSPAKNIKTTFPKKEKLALSIWQLRKLYNTSCKNKQLKNAFLFSCYTGLRRSDIKNLKRENIQGDYLVVTASKNNSNVRNKLTKSMMMIIEAQKVLIKDTIRYCSLRRMEFDKNRLFSFPIGGRSSKLLQKWFVDSGIIENTQKDLGLYTFHTARHTFVTNIVKYHGNIATAKELAGHSDISTTQIYTHLPQNAKDEAIASLPDLVEE